MTQLPAPPAIRVMAAVAAMERNNVHRPTPEQMIHAHITIERSHGRDFAPLTAENDAAFRSRRATNA